MSKHRAEKSTPKQDRPTFVTIQEHGHFTHYEIYGADVLLASKPGSLSVLGQKFPCVMKEYDRSGGSMGRADIEIHQPSASGQCTVRVGPNSWIEATMQQEHATKLAELLTSHASLV